MANDRDDGGAAELNVLVGSERVVPAPSVDPAAAGDAITAFGMDLFGAVRALPASGGANLIVSPASVAIALAMVEPGAVGAGSAALRDLLRIDDPAAFHASMNAVDRALHGRTPHPTHNEGEDPGELTLRIANAAYLQRGYPFHQSYVDAVTSAYGPALHEVDFADDPDAVAREVNRFVAAATMDRIVDIVPEGAFDIDTVLALVNALYLKASWVSVFDAGATRDETFTRLDGTEVVVPLMHGFGTSSARGQSWVGATKSYVGGLSAQFILPDEGRFEDVAADLTGVFAQYAADRTRGGELRAPRFESRFHVELPDVLRALGLGPLFDEPGLLLGIAPDERLRLDEALHEVFIAIDEHGTEAAAATVLTAMAVSAPATPPVAVVLDRPFLFRIVDDQTGATLFLGQVLDPT